MSFESTDTENFPGLYKEGTHSDPPSINEDEFDKHKKRDSAKKKESKKDKKEKGYVMFEEEDSDKDADDKSPSKLKKNKPAFRFSSKDIFLRKEKGDKDEKKDKESKEEKKERKKEGKVHKKMKKSKKQHRSDVLKGPAAADEIDKPIFGVPIAVAVERNKSHDGIELPALFRQCVEYIEEHGLSCEGIYRISGVKSKVQNLKDCANKNVPLYLEEHEPNIIASLLKQFLRELPEPVLTTALMPKFEEASTIKNDKKKQETFLKLIQELPTCNRLLLSWMIVHMSHIIERQGENKMTLQNVSIVLSPTMQISHRVLNILFSFSHILFKDTVIKRYIPPLKPATSKWSLELPDNPVAIKEELLKQESLLNQLHEEFNASQADPQKEEELWEVQRIVTQLKRMLKKAQEAANACNIDKEQKELTVNKNEELRLELQQVPTQTSDQPPPQPSSQQQPQPNEQKLQTSQKQTIKEIAANAAKDAQIDVHEGEEKSPQPTDTAQRDANGSNVETSEQNNTDASSVPGENVEPSSAPDIIETKLNSSSDSEKGLSAVPDSVLQENSHDSAAEVKSAEREERVASVLVSGKEASVSSDNKETNNTVPETTNTQSLPMDTQSLATDSQSLAIDTQSLTTDTQSLATDTPSLSIDTQSLAMDTQSLTKEESSQDAAKEKSSDCNRIEITSDDKLDKNPPQISESNLRSDNALRAVPDNDVHVGEMSSTHEESVVIHEEEESSDEETEFEETKDDVHTPQPELHVSDREDSPNEQTVNHDAAVLADTLEDLMERRLEEVKADTEVSDGDDTDSDATVSTTPVKGLVNEDHDIIRDLAKADIEEDLEKLLDEEYALKLEEEELLAIGDELKKKIETEQNEIERLKQEIIELQYLRQDSDVEESSTSSESSYESEDEEDLQDSLNQLMKENEELERQNAELTQKIHEERMHCLDVKVKIRLLQQKQHETSVYGECILDTDNPI